MVSSSVWNEMEDIEKQDISPSLAKRAQTALAQLRQLIAQDREGSNLSVARLEDPNLDFSAEELDPNSVADVLVASIIAYQQMHALEFVILFTDDKETRQKARKAGIEIGRLPNAYLLGAPKPQQPVAKQPGSLPKPPPKTLTPEHLAQPGPLFSTSAPPSRSIEPDLPSETVSDNPSPAKMPTANQVIQEDQKQAAPTKNNPQLSATQPEQQGPLPSTPRFEILSTASSTPVEKISAKKDAIENRTEAPNRPESRQPPAKSPVPANTEDDTAAPEQPVQVSPDENRTDKNRTDEYKPPFLEMRQQPARPDPGYVEFFNMPAKKETDPGLNGHEKKPLSLPPIALESNGSGSDAAKSTPSFSFSNRQPAVPAPPANPFEPLVPSEESKPAKTELRLTFEKDENRTTVILHHPSYPTIEDISNKLSHLRKNYPKLTHVIGSNSGDGIGNDLASVAAPHEMLLQRRAQRIKRYNNTLDTFYKRSEKYMSELADFENLRKRSAKLNLSLLNDIPDSLKSLYIAIHFPSNVRVYSEDNLPEAPQGPKPPDDPDLDALFDTIRLPVVPIPSELSNSDSVKMRSRNIAPMEVRWNKGWDVIYSIKEIGKHERVSFNPLFIVFNSFDHATAFRIHYRITVASASYEELGELEVLVRKEL